jgi:4-amino-4-deoxy-L-arabinose transferase-like glycosyltransferase
MRLAPLLVLYLAVALIVQPGPELARDEPDLIAAAERLIEHGQLAATGDNPDHRSFLWHGPGLVVLIAPLVALGVPLEAMRLLSPLLLFCAVLLFHRLLRVRLAPRAALRWTYALALYAPFILVLGTIQKEPLAVLLVVAAMLACTRAFAGGGRWPVVAGGLALAALAMVRLEYGWAIVALLVAALLAWPRGRTRAPLARRRIAVAGVALLACVPWLAFTYAKTDQPMYWGSSSGLSLFWMSPTLPGETGQWHSPERVLRDPALAPYRPLFRRLERVHPLESDLELRRRALENIRARPLQYARNIPANATRLLVNWPSRPARPPGTTAMHLVFNALLIGGLLWAAPRLWRSRRALPPETAPFALFALLGVAIHIPPSASPRMLLPLVPVLLWFVAVAASGERAAAAPAPDRATRPRRPSSASPASTRRAGREARPRAARG